MRDNSKDKNERALWVWTQAMQAALVIVCINRRDDPVKVAASHADGVVEEARKRFGGLM